MYIIVHACYCDDLYRFFDLLPHFVWVIKLIYWKTRALQSTYPVRYICISLRVAGTASIYIYVFVDEFYLMLGQLCT